MKENEKLTEKFTFGNNTDNSLQTLSGTAHSALGPKRQILKKSLGSECMKVRSSLFDEIHLIFIIIFY